MSMRYRENANQPWKKMVAIAGPKGDDGTSPTITVEDIASGHRLTITDASGSRFVDIMDGERGQDGYTPQKNVDYFDGHDGVSPTIAVEAIAGGHRLTITDATGSKSVDVMDGADGEGAGDMRASVYDPNNYAQDIFAYVDKAVANAAPSEGGNTSNIIAITIPAGRMRGDVDGDGRITQADGDLLMDYNEGTVEFTDPLQLLAADVNNDGSVNTRDYNIYLRPLINGTELIGVYGEVTGNWTVNPDYKIDAAQFYTDIPVNGITKDSFALITVKGDDTYTNFRAECLEGAIRFYAELCPPSDLEAVVQYTAGDGSAIIVCAGGEETDPTVPAWAKAEKKPTYTAEEVGALPANTVIPVVPNNVSEFKNDASYLSESDLQAATDAALAQAKASGEFDGTDGDDGVSCTHSWNGTTLSVTSASGTSSADLKGDTGEKGDAGVYVGEEEPTDDSALVWITDDDEGAIDERINEAVQAALSAALTGEVWTFTYADGTVEEKEVALL